MNESKRHLVIINVITFVDLLAVGIIFPILGPHFASLGLSVFAVSALSSIYAALQIIAGPIFGCWSDVRGRKQALYLSVGSSTLCYFLMGLIAVPEQLFLLRLLLGVFKHTQTLTKALIADLCGHDRSAMSSAYGKSTSFGTLGFVVGPLIGGYLSDFKEDGFTYSCFLVAILFVFNFMLISWLPKTSATRKVNSTNDSLLKSILSEFREMHMDLKSVPWSYYGAPFFLSFTYILTTTMFFTNQHQHLRITYDFTPKHTSCMISFISGLGVVAGFLHSRIIHKFYPHDAGPSNWTFVEFSIMSLCFIALFFSTSFYLFVACLIPFALFNAFLRISTMQLIMDRSRETEHGGISGALASINAMARFAAPISAAIITEVHDEGHVLMFAAIMSTIASIVSFCLLTDYKRSKKRKS